MRIDLTPEEYDWLVGLFLADGSKFIAKRGYCICFYLSPFKDKKVLDKLLSILEKMNFKPSVRLSITINTLVINFYSKSLYNILPKKSHHYNPKSKEAFIAGFLDGDGFIIPKRDCIGVSQRIVKWICPFINSYLRNKGINSWYKNGVHSKYGTQYYRTSLNQVKMKTQILNLMAKRI